MKEQNLIELKKCKGYQTLSQAVEQDITRNPKNTEYAEKLNWVIDRVLHYSEKLNLSASELLNAAEELPDFAFEIWHRPDIQQLEHSAESPYPIAAAKSTVTDFNEDFYKHEEE